MTAGSTWVGSARGFGARKSSMLAMVPLGGALAVFLAVSGAASVRAALAADPAAQPASATDEGQEIAPVLFDKDKPIEITSDRLDVDQEAQVAVFDGKVDAIQGDFRLTADKLTVHYDQPAGTTGPKEAETSLTGDPSGGSRRIRRMDVVGNVKIVSPTETATGDTAVYEVEKGTIDLMGNVVLTRGQNVIRGTKLTTNVDTGKSVIKGGNQSVGGTNGRVKSLFVPEKKEEDQKTSKTP